MFDPTTWEEVAPCRLSLCNRDDAVFALLDPVDFAWAQQWSWSVQMSRARPGKPRKQYAVRVECRRINGVATYRKLWLHKEVLRRAVGEPPDEHHAIGDHRNGASLDCRRENLRWATASMNRVNRNGAQGNDLLEKTR